MQYVVAYVALSFVRRTDCSKSLNSSIHKEQPFKIRLYSTLNKKTTQCLFINNYLKLGAVTKVGVIIM